VSKNNKIIDKIIKITETKYTGSVIYLYGSRARGDSKKISDWDLLILLDKRISFEDETRLMDDFYRLELETGEIISPLIYSKSDWNKYRSLTSLYENIRKEGIRIK
jgi:predicted nucleotidyltransferase